MAAPTTSTSTSSTTSTSTTTTLWFNIRDYQRLTGQSYTGATDRFYDLVNDVGEHLEETCGVLFSQQTITEEEVVGEYFAYGRSDFQFYPKEFSTSHIALRLTLKWRPVNSISEVLSYEKGDEVAIELSDLTLRSNLGIAYLLTTTGKPKESVVCKVTYNAGFASKPSRILRALALLVREWLDADSAGAGGLVKAYRIGDYSETRVVWEKEDIPIGLGTALSRQAAELLSPWMKKLRIA